MSQEIKDGLTEGMIFELALEVWVVCQTKVRNYISGKEDRSCKWIELQKCMICLISSENLHGTGGEGV